MKQQRLTKKTRFPAFFTYLGSKIKPLSSYYSTLSRKMQYFLVILAVFVGIFVNLPVERTNATSTDVQVSGENSNSANQKTVQIAKNSAPKSINVNDFSFSDFTADYYLYKAEDGTSRLKVIERFTAEFPSYDQNRGIIRVIPFTNQDGKNLTMSSADTLKIGIRHNGISEEPYLVESEEGYFKVTIRGKDFVHGTQYYELTYEFVNVITEFSDFQELYWDTNGNDWQQKFKKVTARLHVDEGVFNQIIDLRTSCYVGSFGSTNQAGCEVRRSGEGYEFIANNLRAGENLTFAVDFEPGTFKMGEKVKDYRFLFLLIAETILLLGLIAYAVMTHLAAKPKRDYYKHYFVKPEYQPAKNYSVAEMATNYMSSTSSSQIKVATLMEMAVQGKIKLLEIEGSKKKWAISVQKDNLNLAERNLLQVLAGKAITIEPGVEIRIKKHTGTSALLKLAQKFPGYIKDALIAKGLEEKKPRFNGNILMSIICVWLVVGIILHAVLLGSLPTYYESIGGWPLIAASALLYLATVILGIYASVANNKYFSHTKKGLEHSRYMDGLKLYIKMAEAERIRFLQSIDGTDTSNNGVVKLYEKLLPYAIVFGEEKSWLNEMGKYYEMSDVKNPTWYRTDNTAFNALMFSSMINSVVKSADSSIRSSYSYSSASGSSSSSFGGGGGSFSGGGGGGGGGGGC